MTSSDILAALADDPTERSLSDLAFDHKFTVTIIPDSLNELDAIGYVVVTADDGLLLIPYTAVTLGHGWEQFDLDGAVVLTEPSDYREMETAFMVAKQQLVKILIDAMAKGAEAS